MAPLSGADGARLTYEPALDGLRGISVLLVLLYHAGFAWMSGGFFGVEVFFVVSGFLITSLLLVEHDRSGRVTFRGFWARRARRLFPALAAVLLAVMVWTAIWGTAEQVAQVRLRQVGLLQGCFSHLGAWGEGATKYALMQTCLAEFGISEAGVG